MAQNSMTLKTLLERLGGDHDAALVFQMNDRTIHPGYHVTEVKRADIQSIDCGRGSERWTEVIVQLLDGRPDGRQDYMSVGKFKSIVAAADRVLVADGQRRLFFEFAPGNGPLTKLAVAGVERQNDRFLVNLRAETAVCKPYRRLASSTTRCCRASAQ